MIYYDIILYNLYSKRRKHIKILARKRLSLSAYLLRRLSFSLAKRPTSVAEIRGDDESAPEPRGKVPTCPLAEFPSSALSFSSHRFILLGKLAFAAILRKTSQTLRRQMSKSWLAKFPRGTLAPRASARAGGRGVSSGYQVFLGVHGNLQGWDFGL